MFVFPLNQIFSQDNVLCFSGCRSTRSRFQGSRILPPCEEEVENDGVGGYTVGDLVKRIMSSGIRRLARNRKTLFAVVSTNAQKAKFLWDSDWIKLS